MTLSSVLMFSKSLLFPKSEKKSSAQKSISGSILCIGLSVIPLIVVLATTNGMVKGMTERIIQLDKSHLCAYVANGIPQTQNEQAFNEYAKKLSEINGVKVTYPEIGIQALAVGKNIRTGIQIRGVQHDIFSQNQHFNELFEFTEGSIADFEKNEKNPAIIGNKMAETLSLKCGDSFRIISTKTTGNKTVPKVSTFTVSGIITSGYQELDELWVFIPIKSVYKNFDLKKAVFNVLIETYDAFAPSLVGIQRNVQKVTGHYANVYRWDQLNAYKFENFSSTKVMLVFIMMMIVLVASINISSAIVMLVVERRREIAILKSVGASPKGIGLAFVIAGGFCGLSGLIIGVPVGIIFSVNANFLIHVLEKFVNFVTRIFYIFRGIPVSQLEQIKLMDPASYLQKIPVELPVKEIILVIAGTFILSVLVSLIPSIKAGNEKPLENLRG